MGGKQLLPVCELPLPTTHLMKIHPARCFGIKFGGFYLREFFQVSKETPFGTLTFTWIGIRGVSMSLCLSFPCLCPWSRPTQHSACRSQAHAHAHSNAHSDTGSTCLCKPSEPGVQPCMQSWKVKKAPTAGQAGRWWGGTGRCD